MKLWKYIYFNELTESFIGENEVKEPYVWSEIAPDSDYEDVTTTEAILSKIKRDYKTFEKHGNEYFEKIRADLVLLYKTGQKTDLEIFGIEAKLQPVIEKIRRGDWLTASHEMTLVVVVAPLDQSLFDDINIYITNYITDNY